MDIGQVAGRDTVVTPGHTTHGVVTNRGVGEQRQLSRGVWSAVGRYLRENVNYRDFDRNVSVIVRTKNVDTKHFVLLISVYTLNLSHFARHSPPNIKTW